MIGTYPNNSSKVFLTVGPWVKTVAKASFSPLGISTAQATIPGINSSLSILILVPRVSAIVCSNLFLSVCVFVVNACIDILSMMRLHFALDSCDRNNLPLALAQIGT